MSGARHLRLIFVPYFQRFSIIVLKNRIKYGILLPLARGFATIHTIYDGREEVVTLRASEI